VSLGVSFRGALAAITLLLTGSAAPVHAQTKDTPPPDAVVAAFEAALDVHDANRAAQQLSETATVLGMDSASGRQITVIAAHRRPAAEPPPDGIAFVRARTLAGAADGPMIARPGAWSALIAAIVCGLLAGLYVVSGTAPRDDASLSVQKGRLVPALGRRQKLREGR